MFVGFLTHGMMEYHAPKEDLIEIDMSMVQPQRARADTPKLQAKAPARPLIPAQPQAPSVPHSSSAAQSAPKAAALRAETVSAAPAAADGWMAPAGGASSEAAVEEGGAGTDETAVAEVGETGGEGEGDAIGRFLSRVEERKEYPFMAVRRNLTGVVTVGVAIDADGNLLEAYVAKSSGANVLDEAGLKAVRNSCPFPHDVGRTLRMNIPISFYLH